MMNDKIKELDKEAQEYARKIAGNNEDSNYTEWFNVYKEKFAELIVRECAAIANRAENDEYWIAPVGDLIDQHFRFKE